MAGLEYRKGKLITLLGLCGGLACGCGGANTEGNTPGTSEAPAPGAVRTNKGVVLYEAMMHNVTVAALSEKSLPRLLTATGKVQFNEDQMARILAPVSGQVQQLRVKVGDPVHKGDILFVI